MADERTPWSLQRGSLGAEQHSWALHGRDYIGDILALCFIPLPEQYLYPALLAGTGSQIHVYDIRSGENLLSFSVFQGIRVHGISCSPFSSSGSKSSSEFMYLVAVFGEGHTKLLDLHFYAASEHADQVKACSSLKYIHKLPTFNHWVMDVCFFRCSVLSHLILGLSNNSVCVWDISQSALLFEVQCQEKCLLYSMRLWGDDLDTLRVASGTIYNEIIIWKFAQRENPSSACTTENSNANVSGIPSQPCNQSLKGICITRLTGHKGSIFRIAWSGDGSRLVSVSDDRSALVWTLSGLEEDSQALGEVVTCDSSSCFAIYGHDARIWDCYIFESIIITAGEDCTCRVWGMDGTQHIVVKEHIGRGIWRCLYDPRSSLLITAGFDAAIRIHHLCAKYSLAVNQKGMAEALNNRPEAFSISTLNASEYYGQINSKSEYIRCLQLARQDVLYVATNRGHIYHLKVVSSDNVKWTSLVQLREETPIICMDLLCVSPDLSQDVEDCIAIGDGKGHATVFKVFGGDSSAEVKNLLRWPAEAERQLLKVFWCKSLGCNYLFTADPGGRSKLWFLGSSSPLLGGLEMPSVASLVAEFTSCMGRRITSLDASFEEEVLVCGDQHGNLIVFPLLRNEMLASLGVGKKIESLIYFRGAHGISCITSVLVYKSKLNQVHIFSTGGDGCICHFKFDRNNGYLEFLEMKRVSNLSLVQTVVVECTSANDQLLGTYAVGFASREFIIWDLVNETKALIVPCGGWRRPHTYIFGSVLRTEYCFAYLKDHIIHVHRLWLRETNAVSLPKILNIQFHGREIHSLCFLPVWLSENSMDDVSSNVCWITTGCEDGTLRLTRYDLDGERWSSSELVGKLVDGSAVRSVCFASKIHLYAYNCLNTEEGRTINIFHENYCLLISAGAKQVLMCWILRKEGCEQEKIIMHNGQSAAERMSLQWLSTHIPPKLATSQQGLDKFESNFISCDHMNNDWRYLAVTAFLVSSADCRFLICFVVVSCSIATVTLHAILLPSRLWYDVARLLPQTSPVLCLQHVWIPTGDILNDEKSFGGKHLIVGGSTDGNITLWDLTETIDHCMREILVSQPDGFVDCHRRPRTGRGSQGGRWWKFLPGPSKGAYGNSMHERGIVEKAREIHSKAMNVACADSRQAANSKNCLKIETATVHPLYVVNSVHHSGVNCLHVFIINTHSRMESDHTFSVLSGGDDQALSYLVFSLSQHLFAPAVGGMQQADAVISDGRSNCIHWSDAQYKLKLLYQNRIASAHSSALKGIWADRNWAFSAGLDQRLRCWQIDRHGKLSEYALIVIDVPEPETLDVHVSGRNQYRIAIAGRGMQMVQFSGRR